MKKLLSVLLCIAMLIPMCTAFPVNANDETAIFGPNDEFVYTLTSDGYLLVSGMGDLPNISFANKTYPVVTAEILEGITSICAGAFSRCTSLKEVKFPEQEFYTIWDNAFRKCTALTYVEIPYCTEYIGAEAFMGCTALERILIPTSVTTIMSDSFSECSALTIVCAEGSYAEEYAKQYNIPYEYCEHEFLYYFENDDVDCTGCGTMTAICEHGCGGTDVKPYEGTPTEHLGGKWVVTKQPTATEEGEQSHYCDVCGNIIDVQPYNTDRGLITMSRDSGFGNNAYLYSDGTMYIRGTGSTYNFHSSQLPFDDWDIRHLVVEEGITAIGDYLLKDCSMAETVSLCEGITKIGKEAFYNCGSLASVNIPTTLTEVGSSAFYLCPELHTVYISDIDSWFNIYFSSALNNPLCNEADLVLNGEKVTHLTVPGGIATVDRNLFYNCTSIESVTVPEGVTNIEDSAFMRCLSLSEISLPSGLTHIGSSAFTATAYVNNTANWTDGVLYIDSYLIDAESSLTQCHIAEGTTLVGESAFNGCNDLMDITIPTSVKWIGNNAFASGYTYDKSNWENGALYIDGCLITIDSTASKNFVIKDGTRLIADLAFYFVSGLTSLTVPESVTDIGNDIFINYYNVVMKCYKNSAYDLYAQSRPNMKVEYICNHSFTNYVSNNDATCTEDGTKTAYCDGDCGKTDTVADVGSALGHTEGEWVITKEPTSDTEGEKTLYCAVCSAVIKTETIEKLPSTTNDVDGGSLTDTVSWRLDSDYTLFVEGDGAMPDFAAKEDAPWYSYRYKIMGLEIAEGITHIGARAFYDCVHIPEIIIPDSVKTIGTYAFRNTYDVASVTFGSGVESVGEYCFKGGEALTDVYVKDLGAWCEIDFADSDATPLNLATFENLWHEGEVITELSVPGGVTKIGQNTFLNYKKLVKVTLPEGVEAISNKAFDGCTNLKELNLPETLTTIGKNTFRNCTALTEVYIPSSVTSIDKNGFYNCTGLNISCEAGSYAESFAKTNSIPYTTASAEPKITGVSNYTVTLKNITDIKEIRYAIGHYTKGAEVRAAEKNQTLSASLVAKYTVDGVMTYETPWVGEHTFWVRLNDGSEYFLYADVTNITPYLEADGLRLTVKDFGEDYRDMWIAEGTWSSYSEIKNNVASGAKYQAAAAKLSNYFANHDFTYVTSNPGAHTVLIRYNDGTQDVLHIDLTVDVPTFDLNGLQVTVGNIPGVKIIRTAYGEYNSVAEIKSASGVRNFNNSTAIKDAESYKIQYRDNGAVTIIVEHVTGYKHIEHINIQQKVPTFTQDGNKVTIGDLDGLVIVRYAPGKYTTSNAIKNAEGSKYVKPESIVDGKIVVTDLEAGTWTFCVQYDDESYNFYTIIVE